ncbi:MAG: FAD:protein FMN transferase [Candidatus Latescibacterota bacterium]|nr:MAG: FAD:protein FMN transferase [Candidatus Latescibacterota bacterium]
MRSPRQHNRPLRFFVALLTLVALSTMSCSTDSQDTIELSGLTMGTTWSVKVVTDSQSASSRQTIWDLINEQIDTVNDRMSHYLDTSELSRFNASTSTKPFPISRATADVLRAAIRIGEVTDGALDITVGPLVDAWGFGPPGEPPEPPSDETIAQLLAITGLNHLDLDHASSTVAKDNPRVRVNLASIAKGYGVDRVAETLEGAGYDNYMVEIGGEVRVSGHRKDGQPWNLAVERPQTNGRSRHTVLAITEGSLATSGDYRFYRDTDGGRISHIIDPRTGRPIHHALASVTVFDSLCINADGFATALLVLGQDEGFELAEKLGLAALFLIRTDDGNIEERVTSNFNGMPTASPRP